ncbi:hypothetical protein GCM10027053_42910 [Intrasporangium mesophilum]
MVHFVQKNLDTLARLPSAFFSVSLAAYGHRREGEGYIDQFEEETGWHADKVAFFGGAQKLCGPIRSIATKSARASSTRLTMTFGYS